jgi:hypothetical protein
VHYEEIRFAGSEPGEGYPYCLKGNMYMPCKPYEVCKDYKENKKIFGEI